MAGSNIKNASAITPVMADKIVAWLDAQREGPAPVAPSERVEVWTLPGLTVVFVGDREVGVFHEDSLG